MANQEAETTITVLLVDDQRFVGAALGQLLAGEPDIALHCCQRATDAVARANDIRPSVILQDLVLPDIDGLTMVRLFRANPATALTPIVVLSASDDAETRAKAMAAGASDYLVKLPSRDAVVACIRRHVACPVSAPVAAPRTAAADETLSRGVLAEFREEGSDCLPDFALMLIDQYVEEATSQVALLKEARLRHDAGAVKATAHTLRGSSMTMGAKRLASLCATMEQQVESAWDAVMTPDMIADVDLEFVKVRAALAVERLGAGA
jgi:DNA-binding response OmpR family regulator